MPEKKEASFGSCGIAKISPHKEDITPDTKVLNLHISFEEALKLNLAIDECLRTLNKYNRSMKEGKRTALNMAIHLHADRITIVESKI